MCIIPSSSCFTDCLNRFLWRMTVYKTMTMQTIKMTTPSTDPTMTPVWSSLGVETAEILKEDDLYL